MKRREFTNTQKMQIVARAMNAAGQVVCEGCGLVLGSKKYEIDHTIPEALVRDKTRPLTIEDGQLLGMACCHRGGKTAADVGRIAKAKRQEAAHFLPKKTKFRRPDGVRFDWKQGRYVKETTT